MAIVALCLPALARGQIASPESFPVWDGGATPNIQPGMVRRQCAIGHFNQDQRADLACYTSIGGDWHVTLSTGQGWETARWTRGPAPNSWIERQCVVGSFNADDRTDLACFTYERSDWHLSLSQPDGYTFPVWRRGPTIGEYLPGECVTGYFDQNRLTDIACSTGDGQGWHIALSTGSGWQTSTWSSGPTPAAGSVHLRCVTGAFNDDELTDLACHRGNGVWRMAVSSTEGYSFPSWGRGAQPSDVSSECVTGQFNDDGRTGLACYAGEGGHWTLMQSTTRGWQMSSWTDGPQLERSVHEQCLTGDLNRDAMTDLACYSAHDGTWNLWLSSSGGYAADVWTQAPTPSWPIDHQCVAADFTGDSATDLACFPNVGDLWEMVIAP